MVTKRRCPDSRHRVFTYHTSTSDKGIRINPRHIYPDDGNCNACRKSANLHPFMPQVYKNPCIRKQNNSRTQYVGQWMVFHWFAHVSKSPMTAVLAFRPNHQGITIITASIFLTMPKHTCFDKTISHTNDEHKAYLQRHEYCIIP